MATSVEAVPTGKRAQKAAARARARLEASSALRTLGRRAISGINAQDPRFGTFVRALSSRAQTLEDIIDDANIIRSNLDPEEIVAILDDLRSALDVAKRLSLTSEILAICNRESKVTQEAVLYRLGLLSEEPMTLRAAADLVGVTHERIRQIQVKREKLLQSKPYMPVYASAWAALNHAVMSGARKMSDIDTELHDRGALQERDFVAQIVRLAQLRGEQRCQIERQLGHNIIGFAPHLERLQAAGAFVTDFIEAQTKKHGACPRTALVDALVQHSYTAEAEDERLDLVLQAIPDLVTIQAGGHVWLRLRSRAYTVALMARKVLSVAPRIRASDLRRGIQRHHRVKTVPPSTVLARIVAAELADWNVTIDDEWVTANKPMSPEDTLPWLDLMFYEALSANGGVMARNDLFTEMKARGMNISSFGITLGYSPIIESYGRGVYGLRGAPVSPGQVEALAAFYQRTRREAERDFGHLGDGRVWLTRELGDYEIDYRTIHLPSAIRDYVPDGEYTVTMDGVDTPYAVSVSVNQIRFKRNTLEGAGAETGDYVLLVFHRKNMTVEVAIGDENVVGKASGNEPEAADAEGA